MKPSLESALLVYVKCSLSVQQIWFCCLLVEVLAAGSLFVVPAGFLNIGFAFFAGFFRGI